MRLSNVLFGVSVALSVAASTAPVAVAQQQAAAPAPPSAEARKAAAKLADMLGFDHTARNVIANARNQLIGNLMGSSDKSQEDASKIVDELIMPEFNATAAELDARVIDVWASNYTASEINGLIAFYQTPLGHKFFAASPMVNQESGTLIQQWGQAAFQSAVQKHGDELRARGVKM